MSECFICTSYRRHFWSCPVCLKQHCEDCHERLLQRRCPFCRTWFYDEPLAADQETTIADRIQRVIDRLREVLSQI